jgi:hypothetical protein
MYQVLFVQMQIRRGTRSRLQVQFLLMAGLSAQMVRLDLMERSTSAPGSRSDGLIQATSFSGFVGFEPVVVCLSW